MSLGVGIFLVILISASSTIPYLISDAEATSYQYRGKALGIIISKSCQMAPNCLKYSQIKDFDNSNPMWTGKMVLKNNDYYRQATSNQNNYKWLEFSKNYIVIVDPPLKYYDQIPIVTIVPSLDEYHLQGQMAIHEYKIQSNAKATKSIRSSSTNWYVDQTCTNSIISAKSWKQLLPEMISYLRNNCDSKFITIPNIKDLPELYCKKYHGNCTYHAV